MQHQSDITPSLFFFKETNMNEDNTEIFVEQFVDEVERFSSQYGRDTSVSYTVCNLCGPPTNFPRYGECPYSCVMRTYGKWWDEAPSFQEDYVPQNSPRIKSQDFVEVSFQREVFPLKVTLFEINNPGALVRIWAYGLRGWVLLWEGEPAYAGDKARAFTPPIKQVNFPTRTLCLEFNHTMLPYYTGLDGVWLWGIDPNSKTIMKNDFSYTTFCNKTKDPVITKGILDKVIALNLHSKLVLPKMIQQKKKEIATGPHLGEFQKLPDETILKIMKYLDMQSLNRCAQVNRHFNRLASDAMLYSCIDLRPYWYCVQSEVLATLGKRCKFLKKLDLSWCGSHCMIDSIYVSRLLQNNGSGLTHLRMNCCDFVDSLIFMSIVCYSDNLQELCLRSIIADTDWIYLMNLTKLRRLDLYSTDIGTDHAVGIVKSNPNLQHVSFGSCKSISEMDRVAIALGANCPNLISVDFWKSYTLTAAGIRALGNCKMLQELDLGWCLLAAISGEWLSSLAGTELRKLFLSALRGICNRDLRSLIPRTPRLAQLDLLGIRAITPDICSEILASCRELRLLDVSFCDQIDEFQVILWRKQYPHVSIKQSFNYYPDLFPQRSI